MSAREDIDSTNICVKPGRAGTALRDLRALLRITPIPIWTTPTLIGLGLAASFAETLGISLVVLFLYSAMGQADQASATGGVLGVFMSEIAPRLGGGIPLASLIFLLIIMRGLLALAYGLISARVSSRISEIARNLLHHRYLTVPYDFIRRQEQGKLLEILATESWAVASAHLSLTRLVINSCSIVVFAAFLIVLSWKITLLALAGSVVLSWGIRRLTTPVRRLGLEGKRVNQVMAERILLTLQGMRTIRAFAQEGAHQAAFVSSSAAATKTSLQIDRLYALVSPATEIGYFAILCLIVGFADWLHASFAVTLASVALLYRLQPHVREFEGNLLHLAQLEPQLRSVLSLLDCSSEDYPRRGDLPIERLHKGIRFESVWLSYAGSNDAALQNVSFTIPAGVTTALVGESGAGKTTIVNLLLRLYKPDRGRITVDGIQIEKLGHDNWLKMVAVAGQDIDLVEGTIEDNIRLARGHASPEEVAQAAAIAGATEIIEGLAEGYENWIGQQGMNLSGGQRQRIALARAVLCDPQFLILDEAMSALDRPLEQTIHLALRERFVGRTVLLITHRLESALSADHIICLKRGLVVEEGTPRALMANPAGILSQTLNGHPQPIR
jgi:ABC-type multidrug transport system fused ATPase/permease subunit